MGIVPLPDPRQDVIASIVKPQRVVPTTMQFVDIAGLVCRRILGERGWAISSWGISVKQMPYAMWSAVLRTTMW